MLWNSNFKTKSATANYKVAGLRDDVDTANYFAHELKITCSPDNTQLHNEQFNYYKSHIDCNDNNSLPYISVEMVDKAISCIANNTASIHDGIAIEHFRYDL